MKSFDPDDDFPYVEVADEIGRDVADDLSPVDAEATLELLHAVTAGLPGGGEDRDRGADEGRAEIGADRAGDRVHVGRRAAEELACARDEAAPGAEAGDLDQ